MADAKRELKELESRRFDDNVAELAATKETIGVRKVEVQQRVASETLTREVIYRIKQQPSAAQAAARLADVIQRRS
jgi:expansin (peptidoglycan-binding protein)